MICYRDMTFCTADECLNFKSCPRALTDEVYADAVSWWGSENAPPIAQFSDPSQLDCYEVLRDDSPKWYDAHHEIAAFSLPLIRELREKSASVPSEFLQEAYVDYDKALWQWKEILTKIIIALEWIIDEEEDWSAQERSRHEVHTGLNLFSQWFTHLWD